jgi:hypothetical protein
MMKYKDIPNQNQPPHTPRRYSPENLLMLKDPSREFPPTKKGPPFRRPL